MDSSSHIHYGRAMRALVLSLSAVATACGEDIGPRPLHFDLGTCGAVDITEAGPAGIHVAQGSAIDFATNPPTGGGHFALWAAYTRSYASLERGFWVHDLEHGAVVLAYRCDAPCPDTVQQLEAIVRAQPDDPECTAPARTRMIVVADPLLPAETPIAAVAWGAMYTATCVDPPSIQSFIRDFYGRGPEDFCADGASIGGVLIE
jgi:hypothetical protein